MVYTTKYEDIFFYNIRGREKVIYILKKTNTYENFYSQYLLHKFKTMFLKFSRFKFYILSDF